jgi:hypothetical protein
MATSASSLEAGPSEASSRLQIPATTSGLVANTRDTDVVSRLVRAMRWRSRAAREKLGLTLRGLLLRQKVANREKARRKRRNIEPQVSLGSENWALAVPTGATSLERTCFSSMKEIEGTAFSSGGRACTVCELTEGKGMMVEAGLSSLCTADSMAVTCSPICSTRGKNESTTESSIP